MEQECKQLNNEKEVSSFGIYKPIYHKSDYLLLSFDRKWQSFEISWE